MANVPIEPLWAIFTPQVLTQLAAVTAPSPALSLRLQVLAAGGLNPSPGHGALRAEKSAWETYFTAAFACGLFEGHRGSDLRARLTGTDDDNFRSALSECFAVWYLAGHRRLPVKPTARGQGNRVLEFAIDLDDGQINVEVKAPYRQVEEEPWWGNDSDLLESALQQASKQFACGERNLLVLVPTLRIPVFGFRSAIENAFIGQEVIRIPIDTRTGDQAGPERLVFKQDGRLSKYWGDRPQFTRVGAVLVLGWFERDGEIRPRALIVQNPNAAAPLPHALWAGIPEYVCRKGRWIWTDAEGADAR